ncbi:MAG: hypothetical protein GXX96_09995 [Planctomycetaceae bacterium]|nr:hypothetical protein [Planctomycetaceae bacterium]
MSDIETGKRRRFQFSLRTLLLAITLSAVLLGTFPLIGRCVASIGTCGVVCIMCYAMIFAVRSEWRDTCA